MREPAHTRQRLPSRRLSKNISLEFRNQPIVISTGFYSSGAIGEVFIDTGKTGTDIQTLAHDAAVVVSIAIQCGASIAELCRAVLRDADGTAVSVVGAILDSLLHEEEP